MTYLCVHCGQPIVKVNWALGEQWMHDPVGQGRTHDFIAACQTAPHAAPDENGLVDRGPNTGIYARTGS